MCKSPISSCSEMQHSRDIIFYLMQGYFLEVHLFINCLSVFMQFDLQRMMIYCDSKHAELETCCDLPNGPVSILGSVKNHQDY